jgi:hypothetical protein
LTSRVSEGKEAPVRPDNKQPEDVVYEEYDEIDEAPEGNETDCAGEGEDEDGAS